MARYIGRHRTERVATTVLPGAVAPLMLRTDANPEGLPIEAFDAIRAGVDGDRSQYYWEPADPFYGFTRPGAEGSDGMRRTFRLWSMPVGLKGAYDCIAQFSEQDFTGSFRAHAGCKDASAPPPCNLNHVNILSDLRREEEGCLEIHGRPQPSGRSLNG